MMDTITVDIGRAGYGGGKIVTLHVFGLQMREAEELQELIRERVAELNALHRQDG
jgi:hypothetical protein